MALNNLILIFFLLIFCYYFSSFLVKIINNSKSDLFLDKDYKKPQAFHERSTYRIGGVVLFVNFSLVTFYLYFVEQIFFVEFFTFSTFFFLLGIVDDVKINIPPKFRLLIMIIMLLFLINFNDLYIEKTGLEVLNYLLKMDIFSLIFVCLCFLFIINGSNLIDGFNGLLGIHSFIILSVLFCINYISGNYDLAIFLIFINFLVLIFLKFNFPKSKIFLGDSGSYLVGSLIAVATIKTSILNPSISPFFFCIILFYLFFEVFFSFLRKILVAKQSPLLPDNFHLHMNLYKFLYKKNKNKLISNYKVSIYINIIYLILITPGIIFMPDGIFCRYYFLLLLVIYVFLYKTVKAKL